MKNVPQHLPYQKQFLAHPLPAHCPKLYLQFVKNTGPGLQPLPRVPAAMF